VDDLASAEEAMLGLYAERADLVDGQEVLDLGCGWGSFTLWAAEKYPTSHIVAVSNSAPQRAFIESEADLRGLTNIEVITSDINEFDPVQRFDRIVSIEMLEHVRNHRALFKRMRNWIDDAGAVFAHVFGHREFAYPFETEGRGAWMAQTFFTGGVMPSPTLLPEAGVADFAMERTWWLSGHHYARTLRAWLERQDRAEAEVRHVLSSVYGSEVDRWIQRWRMFYMACEEMFAFDHGRQWGVLHQLFRPTKV
jgi:cyclopropane-fatty-acyl-phospholipid synthase